MIMSYSDENFQSFHFQKPEFLNLLVTDSGKKISNVRIEYNQIEMDSVADLPVR